MPFILMFSDGTYFRKTGRAHRTRVTDLQQATTWTSKGHLKLAIMEAFRYKRDWPTNFQIIAVKLAKFGKRDNLSVSFDDPGGRTVTIKPWQYKIPEPAKTLEDLRIANVTKSLTGL